MKTSCFSNFSGPGRIAISKSVPDHLRGRVKLFRELIPTSWIKITDSPIIYREKYLQQLSRLDPAETWDVLHGMVKGHEPILLCYEEPPFDESNFCHRHMVAEWFENELGVTVPEWGAPKENSSMANAHPTMQIQFLTKFYNSSRARTIGSSI